MTAQLFVYGTLAPGKPNEHILSDLNGTWTPGTVNGKLHEEGWGAAMGCPAIIPDENGRPVQGLVFSSEKLDDIWAKLDEFEGPKYERVLVPTKLESGAQTNAYIYRLKDKTSTA